MTTAVTPEIEEHPDIKGLDGGATTDSTAPAKPRRGRPKGSRNRPRTTAPAKPATVVDAGPPSARFVLLENDSVTIGTEKGMTTYKVESQFVMDRRK